MRENTVELLKQQGYKQIITECGTVLFSYQGIPCEDNYARSVLAMSDAAVALVLRGSIIEQILLREKSMIIRPENMEYSGPVFLLEMETGLIKGEVFLNGKIRLDTDLFESLRSQHRERCRFADYPYENIYAWYLRNPLRYCCPLVLPHSKTTALWIGDVRDKAVEYLPGWSQQPEAGENVAVTEAAEAPKTFYAYVDGSYNHDTGVYGSGVILTDENKEIIDQFSFSDTKMNAMRNIAGEIEAARLAIEKAEMLQIHNLCIFHDYEGIAKWPDKVWQAKNKYTIAYAEFVNKKRIMGMNIQFQWVKGHSGDALNEKADIIAKQAAGIEIMDAGVASEYIEPSCPAEVEALRKGINIDCEEAIRDFYRKPKRAFRDYMMLRTGGLDHVSKMTMKDLSEKLEKEAVDYVTGSFQTMEDKVRALRWIWRGLTPGDAVYKINVDKEISGNRGK